MKAEGSMSCREFMEIAAAYLDGALPGAERGRFEGHAQECVECRRYLKEVRLVVDVAGRLRATGDGVTDPARAAAVELFRSQGLHGHEPRVRDVPLGIGKHSAALGDH